MENKDSRKEEGKDIPFLQMGHCSRSFSLPSALRHVLKDQNTTRRRHGRRRHREIALFAHSRDAGWTLNSIETGNPRCPGSPVHAGNRLLAHQEIPVKNQTCLVPLFPVGSSSQSRYRCRSISSRWRDARATWRTNRIVRTARYVRAATFNASRARR